MSWTVRDLSLLVHAPPGHSWPGDRGRPTWDGCRRERATRTRSLVSTEGRAFL